MSSRPQENGNTPLHIASLNGHAELARMLLEAGAKVDARGKKGSTPLHLAAMDGHFAVARLLLDRGAGVDTRNNVRCALKRDGRSVPPPRLPRCASLAAP